MSNLTKLEIELAAKKAKRKERGSKALIRTNGVEILEIDIENLKTMPKLVQALRDLIWEADQNFGELSEKALAQWKAIDEKVEVKAQNTVKFIQELEAGAVTYKERAKNLTAHAKQLENLSERLRSGMIYFLNAADKRQCPTPLFPKLQVKINPASVVIKDEHALFDKKATYLRLGYLEAQDPKIRKAEIKIALKNGKEVDGAELVHGEKLAW